ncbi:hypothetical protein KUTeg_004168 [Tegillarca granosa]|uniref:BTB domain-containing protein n=1 Tax=Tegillarca granosa TaxID=220873 RepID=A0ABQ9FSY2_TEGGR|nr:hypothetical protein KUTeg_004168 [Tegillarca granosa]
MGNHHSGVSDKNIKNPSKYLAKIMAEGGLSEKDLQCDVKLWVSRVTRFSSQYNSTTWSANCLVGKPRVYPKYGDIHGAWAQGTIDSNQFVELKFEEKIYIEKINVYETFHGGAVSCIKVKTPEEKWEAIWTAEEEDFDDITQSRIFSPTINVSRILKSPRPKLVDLATDLSSLVNNKQFSDATFMVEGTLFYAHKAILVVRSDYFRAMFCDQMKEATTTVFADQFSLDALKALAIYEVNQRVDMSNVVDIYIDCIENLPVIENVKAICLNYMRNNMAEVVRSPSFVNLPQEIMLDTIQRMTSKLSIK